MHYSVGQTWLADLVEDGRTNGMTYTFEVIAVLGDRAVAVKHRTRLESEQVRVFGPDGHEVSDPDFGMSFVLTGRSKAKSKYAALVAA